MDLISLLEILAKVGGAIVAVGGSAAAIWRFVWSPIKKYAEKVKGRAAARDAKLNHIFAELSPNHGSSLKDHVAKVVETVNKLEKRQRAAHDMEATAMFESSKFQGMVWANKAFLRMLKASFDEVRGDGWKSYVHPDDKDAVYQESDLCSEEGRDFHMTFRFIDGDRNPFCCAVDAAVLRDSKDTPYGHYGSVVRMDDEKCS